MEDICQICFQKLLPVEQMIFEIALLLENVTESSTDEVEEKINSLLKEYPETKGTINDFFLLFQNRIKDIPLILKIMNNTNLTDKLYSLERARNEKLASNPGIHFIIENDDIDNWIKYLVDRNIENLDEVQDLVKYAISCASEKIINSCILKFGLEINKYYKNIIEGGNLSIISQTKQFGRNSVSIALQSMRPHLAFWLSNNTRGNFYPSFSDISKAFAVNMICFFSHGKHRHIFPESVIDKYSCFAKINLADTSFFYTYRKFLYIKNPECLQIAISRGYKNFRKVLKKAFLDRNVDLLFALADSIPNINEYEFEFPIAAIARIISEDLFKHFIDRGANADNIYVRAVLQDLSLEELKMRQNFPFFPSFVYQFGTPANVEMIKKIIGNSEDYKNAIQIKDIKFEYKSERDHFGIRKISPSFIYSVIFGNVGDLVVKYSLTVRVFAKNGFREAYVFFAGPDGYFEAKRVIKNAADHSRIRMLGLVGNCSSILEDAEALCREYDIRLLIMTEDIDFALFQEIMASEIRIETNKMYI